MSVVGAREGSSDIMSTCSFVLLHETGLTYWAKCPREVNGVRQALDSLPQGSIASLSLFEPSTGISRILMHEGLRGEAVACLVAVQCVRLVPPTLSATCPPARRE